MKQTSKHGHLAVALSILTVGIGAGHAQADTNRLSLNPYAIAVEGGAFVMLSGFDAPLRLPNSGTPHFATGFTIPADYVADTPLRIRILWETPSTGCDVHLFPNVLFRAGAGRPRDGGNAVGGLSAVNASTTFMLSGGGSIIMAAPATAHTTGRVTFRIEPTPGEFPSLRPGDAINFGLFRSAGSTADTCTGDLGIAGISVVYTTS
jgi:hypothetical protein